MQAAQRAVIDAIEAMGPSTIYVETDDQGRARVVRLERAPDVPAIQAEEAESVAAAVQAELARVHGAAQARPLSPYAREAIERCVDTIREVFAVYREGERERVIDRIAVQGGALPQELALVRRDARDVREADAWDRVRPALEALIGDASR